VRDLSDFEEKLIEIESPIPGRTWFSSKELGFFMEPTGFEFYVHCIYFRSNWLQRFALWLLRQERAEVRVTSISETDKGLSVTINIPEYFILRSTK